MSHALGLQLGLIQARHAHRLHRVNMLEPALCKVASGTKRVHLGEQCMDITPGQWLLLPAHVPLGIENAPGPQGYLAQVLGFPQQLLAEFHQAHAPQLPGPGAGTQVMQLSQWRIAASARLEQAWQRLLQSLSDAEPALLQRHKLHEVWLLLALAGQLAPLLGHRQDELAGRVERLLMSDPSADWSQEQVARRFHMSSPTLRRRLAAEGSSFRAILDGVRMALALAHLQTTRRSIEDIAQACGYASASRFAHRFRSRYGLSPRALRQAL